MTHRAHTAIDGPLQGEKYALAYNNFLASYDAPTEVILPTGDGRRALYHRIVTSRTGDEYGGVVLTYRTDGDTIALYFVGWLTA